MRFFDTILESKRLVAIVRHAGVSLREDVFNPLLGAIMFGVVFSAIATAADIHIESVGLSIVHEATVAAQESGVVIDLPVCEGQIVKEKELLVQLDDTRAQKELVQAQIKQKMALQESKNDVKIRMAQTSLKLARIDLRRAEESNKRYANSVTEAKLDRFRLTVERGLLEVEQAEKDLETARFAFEATQNRVELVKANLQRRRITAPIGGQVVEVKRRKGEWVQAGEPVVRIVRTDILRAEAYVAASELVADISGHSALFETDVPGRGQLAFQGRVTFVSPEVNPVNGQVQIWAEVKNQDGMLRPGSLGSLVVAIEDKSDPVDHSKKQPK